MLITHEKCFICGEISEFIIEEGCTLLREAVCSNCGCSIRNSDTARIISRVALNDEIPLIKAKDSLKPFRILEASALGPIHNTLKDLPNYSCFEFFDDISPGQYKDGIQCNDLQNLTFKDNSFDLIITQDVLEHVENPLAAFKEINRVLNNGGSHIFTVPLHEGRLTLNRRGLPIVYHGDPLRREGAVVYTDWGDDITSIIDVIGMKTTRYDLHRFHEPNEITEVDKSYNEYLNTLHLKYFRYNSVIFSSKKASGGTKMDFTGERFVPGKALGEIEVEHLQRYYSIADLVKNKVVLDAACGEGYGSSILAKYAEKVIGVDISTEAINWAKEKYESENLQFVQNSVERLPFKDRSFDIVVSFETIEHVDEEIQLNFLKEIKRVLKQEGFLIISTPDKLNYSDIPEYNNPYHVKEFYYDEFYEFLKQFFTEVYMFDQFYENFYVLNSSGLTSLGQRMRMLSEKNNENRLYVIAICSEIKVANIESVLSCMPVRKNHSKLYIDLGKSYSEENMIFAEYRLTSNKFSVEFNNLDVFSGIKGLKLMPAVDKVFRCKINKITSNKGDLSIKTRHSIGMESFDEFSCLNPLYELNGDFSDISFIHIEGELKSLKATEVLSNMNKWLNQKDKYLDQRNRQLIEKDKQLIEKDKQLHETNLQLELKNQQLKEREKQLEGILNSLSWKITAPLRCVKRIFK